MKVEDRFIGAVDVPESRRVCPGCAPVAPAPDDPGRDWHTSCLREFNEWARARWNAPAKGKSAPMPDLASFRIYRANLDRLSA